jgi:pyrimidine-nucleoside phosphorylase
VGDKTTLIVAPLVAAAGVPVAKLSGRALGHTSGTIDRLEAIPGLRTDLTTAELIAQVKKIGLAVGSQTANLVPADKKLYALRDQTATVEVVSLIAASVMSKKLAGGAEGILLDVKCGKGAFIKDLRQAKELAQIMVEIGKSAGRKMTALITAMEEPLGKAVGEGVETCEAIETLRGNGPADLVDLSLLIASHMICLGGKVVSPESARELLTELLKNGAALEKFRQMVIAQGGDSKVFDNPQSLAEARFEEHFKAGKSGFIQQISAYAIGTIARGLVKNHKGGILLERKVGEKVEKGEVLARLLSDDPDALKEARQQIGAAYVIGDEKPKPLPVLLCPPRA